jgi:hypothetical protein
MGIDVGMKGGGGNWDESLPAPATAIHNGSSILNGRREHIERATLCGLAFPRHHRPTPLFLQLRNHCYH